MANNTIRKIVTKGLREGGIIEKGGIPDADELEEGVDLLQGLFSSFFGNELGEQLTDVNYGNQGIVNSYARDRDATSIIDSSYLPVNIRLIANLEAAKTVYLHPRPMDGARLQVVDNAGNFATRNLILNANGRKIDSAATATLSTNSTNSQWFYRADLGSWSKVNDLDANDISPLPREFDDLLSTGLALRVNSRYGSEFDSSTADVLKRMRKQFRARYRQNMEQYSEDGLIRLPSHDAWLYSNNQTTFDRGRPFDRP